MNICSAIRDRRSLRAITVATVGDSFADSLYNALRSRPDLMQRYGVELRRWSRPIVGLTRGDDFDYAGWLRDTVELGSVDCVPGADRLERHAEYTGG